MKRIRPSFLNTLGRSYLSSLFKPTPQWVHLYVTRHCNFDCQYCGAKDEKRKDPSFAEVCRMILKVKSLGCNSVSLMGGEPTLRKDILEIIRFCSQNNVYTQLPTNGTLLLHPSRNIEGKSLLSNLVSAGLGTINLSVDYVMRGSEASEKKLSGATNVLEALIKERDQNGLIFMLNCVINKQNIKEVPKMLEFCRRKRVMMVAIFVQNPALFKEAGKNEYLQKTLFTPADEKEVCATADYLIAKKKAGYPLIEPFAYFESVKKWIKGELDWSCDGGKYSLGIDTDGKIGICGYLPNLDLNIMDLDRNYFSKLKEPREEYQKTCTKSCLPACMFCSSFFRQNPFQFIQNFLLTKIYSNRP